MKRFTLSLLVPALSVACGSSPAAPTAAAATSSLPLVVAMTTRISSQGDAQGLGSPTMLTLGLAAIGSSSPGTLEMATFKMQAASGEILAEASLTTRTPILPRAGDGTATITLEQTLSWAIERGYGKQVEITLIVRDPGGEARSLVFFYPRS